MSLNYDRALTACRAAAAAANEGDPTGFRGDWSTIVRGAPGAALTGRYRGTWRGINSSMTIIEAAGPAQLAITTVHRRSGHTCTISTTAADDTLTAMPASVPGCVIKIASSGKNRVRVRETNCRTFYCGALSSFEGTYRLQLR